MLNDNGLTGEIPENLGMLSQLTNLALNGNHLEGEIPSALGTLQSLGKQSHLIDVETNSR